MKKFLAALAILVVAIVPVMAQHVKAPKAVQQAFQINFTQASAVSWYKMASGNWFAQFKTDSIQTKVEYSSEGQWIATRNSLTQAQLPDTLTKAIALKYPGATIQKITHIQRADVAPYYQIALQVNDEERDVLANNSGTLTE